MSPNWSGVDKVTLFSFGGTNAGLGGTGAFYSMDNLTLNGYPIDARSLRPIDHEAATSFAQPRQGLDVGLREIRDVNVISYAAAVSGRIIDTEYFKMRPPAINNFAGDLDEMGGDRATLSAATLWVSTGDVEVAEGHIA